jgi:hypothetical protein
MTKIAGSGSISQRQELAVTDLLYNVMNPEHSYRDMKHCFKSRCYFSLKGESGSGFKFL